jgi:aconitate hydratase
MSIELDVYAGLQERVVEGRAVIGRPLTWAEKVLLAHLRAPGTVPERGRSYVDLDPNRVALQDALAQIVALQFMTAGLDKVVIPTTIHCDHLITARTGAAVDLGVAQNANSEVYEFLRAVSAKYGIGFWEPGSGIIHQVVLENFAFPGGMMIGTDSHTPNAGGLGMIAVGVGGGDAIDVMVGLPFNLRWPRLVGVRLTGSLSGWAAPKDVILKVASILGTSSATGSIVEYFGPGAETISATGKATICNMGAELGATASIFPYDRNTEAYLRATFRDAIADAAGSVASELRCDPEVDDDPERFFDRVIEFDLSELRPLINGPDTPDLAHPVGDVGEWARQNGVPVEVSAALVGSCTNSSYEDIARAASVARDAHERGLSATVPFYVTPGSEQVRATIERDGLLGDLEAIGATVLANACGPCIGQWDRTALPVGTPNTIVTSYNRNFRGRNDGRPDTKAFLASPEIVVAYALSGTLDFDPLVDPIVGGDGSSEPLGAPCGETLPPLGFERPVPARHDAADPVVRVSPHSKRLQLLEPFPAWDRTDYLGMPIGVKAKGKCTTDHISAAGKWLAYRGHLENISQNLFLGATNAFTGAVGEGRDPISGATMPYPDVAKHLADAGVRWCIVGDDNYGEGSSRELAAMEPRYRGAVCVFARSFARIHETNLKKQGILALVFTDPAVCDQIEEDDLLSVHRLAELAPDSDVECSIAKPDGTSLGFSCSHTLSPEQIEWFRAGSALNLIRLNHG